MDDTKRKLATWIQVLNNEVNTIVYRLAGTEPTQNFYRDLAYSLERLAARVKREIT